MGLRSGKLRVGKDEPIGAEKEGGELKRGGSDSGDEKIRQLVSGGEEEGGDLGDRENVGAAGAGEKRCVENGKGIDDDGDEKKKVKGNELGGSIRLFGRVLRWQTAANGGSDKAVSDGDMVLKVRESEEFHKQCSEVENEGADQLGQSESVGVDEDLKPGKLADNVQEVDDGGVEKVKEGDKDSTVPSPGRALRSRFVVIGGSDKAESDGSHKQCTEVNVERADQLGGVDENLKPRKLADNGQDIDNGGIEKKKVKEGDKDSKVPSPGRALRSRFVVIGGSGRAESNGSHKQCTEVKTEGADQLGKSGSAGVGEVGKKRKSVDNGQENDDDGGFENKKVNEDYKDNKAPSAGRTLRSRFVVIGGGDRVDSDESHKQCTEVENEKADQLGESENAGVGEVVKKKPVDNGQENDEDGVEKKKVKEGDTDSKIPSAGRALRSRFVVLGGSDKAETDGSNEQCTGVENEMADQLGTGNAGAGEVGMKRKSVDSGQEHEDDGVKKKVKKVDMDNKVPSAGRALRSRFVVFGGSDKKCTEVKNKGGNQFARAVTKKLKGKRGRGRPPKVKKEETDGPDGGLEKKNLKRKRGRPKKVEKEESDMSVGRLRKKSKFEHQRTHKVPEKATMITNGSYLERRLFGKDLDVKKSFPAKSDKKERELETVNSDDGEKSKEQKRKQEDQDNGETSRSRQKQLVRDKMVDLVMRAGWTIQYRPRNGREYMDAVYVSPAGRTHWSVTLAYDVLRKNCEEGGDTSQVCMAGFKFTPLPAEEVEMLKRIVVEGKKKGKSGKASEKNAKRKKGRGIKTTGRVTDEKRKTKLGKSVKGKRLLREQDDSDDTSCKGRLWSGHVQHKKKNSKRCALLVRNSENADSGNDGFIPYDGKRTVLAWMIDLGTLSLNSKVKYMNRTKTQVLLEGTITRDGIHCGCCTEVISVSKFVTHAGSGYSEPLKHVYLDSGSSLLQCLLDSWNKQDEYERRGFHFVEVNREDPNDDTCGICGDGGDLICCDGCPSTFHQSCLEIKKFPSGEWHCVYCSCKFCGMFDGNACRRDGNGKVAASALITCHLCEEKYHLSCIQEKDAVNDDSSVPSFCGKNCQELFQSLHMLLGVKREIEEGYSLTLIRRSDIGSNASFCDTPQKDDCDSKLIESNSKLAVAFLIMDECFLPMVDHRSGVNLIHNILYNRGSNFSRLNYRSFITAILERGDEIISAATIRIHGNYLAEMPFIGTRYMYRRQGMCRRLLSAVESALCSLKVERLVIPAISELTETWTSVFGFESLEESSKHKMKNMNLLVFPGVAILQKPIIQQLTEANMNTVEGLSSSELKHHQIRQEELCDTNERLLTGPGIEATTLLGNDANDEIAVVELDTQRLCGVSQEILQGKSNATATPAELCHTNERLLTGPVTEATALCENVANDELAAIESNMQCPCGVSEEILEGKCDAIMIVEKSCENDERLFTGSGTVATVLCENEATDELAAVESGTQHLCGVSQEIQEINNKDFMIPEELCVTNDRLLTGSGTVATALRANEANDEPAGVESNTQYLGGVSQEILERKSNANMLPPQSMCNDEQTEEVNKNESSALVPDVGAAEVDSHQNQHITLEVESKSFSSHHTDSEAIDFGVKKSSASRMATDNIDREVRIEDDIVENFNSHDQGSICCLNEHNVTELQNMDIVHEVVSDEYSVFHDSETPAPASDDPRELKLKDFQHFRVAGSVLFPDAKMSKICEAEIHDPATQYTRTATEEVYPESIKCCGSRIRTETTEVSSDVCHPTSPWAHQKADDVEGHCTTLPVDCRIDCSSENGPDTDKIVSNPANRSSELFSGDNLLSNGITKSPQVTAVEFTSSCSEMNTKSLTQTEFDSLVDHTSLAECNSSHSSVAGLHCASGGGNSGGTSAVTILSNQVSNQAS